MEEIITSLQNWENIRNQPDLLTELFINKVGFELDMSLFPQKTPLHAYAAVKNGELGFYVISEANDVNSPLSVLNANCYWCPCVHSFSDGQEISEEEANVRTKTWTETFPDWIHQVVTMPFGMYQTFYIPTTDLQPEKYMALFALKSDVLTPDVKAADLVLTNDAGIFYDTVLSGPPFKDQQKYYILSLI